MSMKRKVLLFLLNFCIALVNIFLFSNAFLGLKLLSGTAFSIAASWTAVVLSGVVFITGNKALLATKETRFLMQGMNTLEDCLSVFKQALQNGDAFDEYILQNMEQIKRFRRKYDTIHDLLKQKFSESELSYQKFSGVLLEVERVVFMNMRSILNKIAAFDMDEYETMIQKGVSQDALSQEKLKIFNDYIHFVRKATNANEDIILKLDKLLLEISRYNSLEGGDVQKLPAMVEMDALIHNANLYQ